MNLNLGAVLLRQSFKKIFLSALLVLYSNNVFAQIFMEDEGRSFLDKSIQQRTIGIEIEFGLDDQEIIKTIKSFYPEATQTGSLANGTLIFDTEIGPIKLVIEGQAWRYESDPVKQEAQRQIDLQEAPREIVFPPTLFQSIPKMDALIKELQSKGAKGTNDGLSVSLQVNFEMKPLKSKPAVRDLLNLMRVYYLKEHRAQLDKVLNVPETRRQYVLPPSSGFMKKLMDPDYDPTPREFYDDYMYRQSLELKGTRKAWTLPIADVKEQLLSYEGEEAIVPRVVKMNQLRISSLLLLAFPEEALTKRIIASRWARPAPIVEFREFNNDFSLLTKVRSVLGTVRATELFGAYDHDKLYSDLTGLSPEDIKRLRTDFLSGRKRFVRYVLQDPTDNLLDPATRKYLSSMSPQTVLLSLAPDKVGAIPLKLYEGSVVWHRRNIHRNTILGDYNPGLENWLIQQVLENKLLEAKVFESYVPGSFPETVAYREIIQEDRISHKKMIEKLNQRFSRGWVLKGAWDFSSEKIIITDKTNFDEALQLYKNGFEAYKKKTIEKYSSEDPELVLYYLKKHPGYRGYLIKKLLKAPELLLVQERKRLVEEFRVEVLGGKVLGQGSTVSRFGYGLKRPPKVPGWVIKQAEAFAQKVIDGLPEVLKVIPYGLDVAVTEDGQWVVIETNPGGNSSFLEEFPKSSRALVNYLNQYPELFKNLKGLLSGKEQIQWINNTLKNLGLEKSVLFPGLTFTADDIQDPEFVPRTPEVLKSSPKGRMCGPLLGAA